MSKIKVPGFSAEASLYETGQHYHVGGSVYAAPIRQAVMPQLFPVWTYGDCIRACQREICRFDDIGDLCEACYLMCWYRYKQRATGSL